MASALIAGLLVGGFLGFIVAVVVAVLLVALWSRYEGEPQVRAPPGRRALAVTDKHEVSAGATDEFWSVSVTLTPSLLPWAWAAASCARPG